MTDRAMQAAATIISVAETADNLRSAGPIDEGEPQVSPVLRTPSRGRLGITAALPPSSSGSTLFRHPRATLSFVILVLGLNPRMTRGSKAKHISRMTGYVYIVTNHKHGTLTIGVTSDLERRVYEHREVLSPGFTAKYGCRQLVWYEEHYTIADAIQREKSLKRWYRQWKIELIESFNPQWRDLYE